MYGLKAIANDIQVKPMVRTDPEIARDVVALRIDATVPSNTIKAGISDSFVTLEGTVDWNFQRAAAEHCVRKVNGVRGISNKIQLKPRVSATEVKTKIEDALRRSAVVDSGKITVSASEGTITLTGDVHSWFERTVAESAACAVPGVSCVIDQIAIVP